LINSPRPSSRHSVSIVVPFFNEEEVIGAFHSQLLLALETLPFDFSIIYVNDGSTDQTLESLRSLQSEDARIKIIELSRNFGHQAAITAGLDLADGDYVITMDGDGQHPPSLIPQMLELALAGYDVVLTQRVEKSGTLFKRWSSNLFYNLINRLGNTRILKGGADFRLMSSTVLQSLRSMREYHRFLRGMVAWMGYRTVILPFSPPERLGGHSKYSLLKMLRLAADAIFSFSLVPLYVAISVGVLFLLLALAEAIYVLSFWISGHTESLAPGWSSLMFVLLVVGGSLMITLGIAGVYIGYIFQEVKHRPLYLVRKIWGEGKPSQNSDPE
jgi:polyisoprenyl-phosphate glycosyltransferase